MLLSVQYTLRPHSCWYRQCYLIFYYSVRNRVGFMSITCQYKLINFTGTLPYVTQICPLCHGYQSSVVVMYGALDRVNQEGALESHAKNIT